jgi:hypothetical protein
MRNAILGYLFARATVGERAARTGALVVALLIGLLLLSALASNLDIFARPFFQGVKDGLRSWDQAEQAHRAPPARR